MKLTKDTLIEGQIVKKGANISIVEKNSPAQNKEDSKQYKKFMKDFKDGKMKDTHGNIVKSEKQAHMIATAKSEADDKKKESVVRESELRDIIDRNPEALNLVSKVSEVIDWDIFSAMSFCLELLHDVNAHSEAKETEVLFTNLMEGF